jgi:hypothetical protein
MRKEYQAIADKWVAASRYYGQSVSANALNGAVAECEAFADKPPKMLTDAEIDAAYHGDSVTKEPLWSSERNALKRVIQAHIAKQKEPETVTVRLVKNYGKKYKIIEPMQASYTLGDGESWASDPIEIEVTK